MRLTIDIDDSRLLDELGAVNGTGAVSRLRSELRAMLREAATSALLDSGMADNAIDMIIERHRNRGIVGALTKEEA